MRRLVSAAFILAVCAAALVLAGASDEQKGKTIKIEFDNGFGLTKGGDFRVGGVKAGKTDSFGLTFTKDKRPLAVVTAKVTEKGFQDFRSDASCDIKPQSLIGEYYVDCQPGSAKEKLRKIKGVPTVTVGHTTATIPQDLVQNILRRPYRERFRLILSELGTGLAGRPQDLAAVLRRAHPGLRETDKTLNILARQNTIIKNFIRDSDTVVGQLDANKREVSRFVARAADAAQTTATRRAELGLTLRKLPGFLDQLRPYMVRLGQLADAQNPLLSDLQRAAPSLNTFLTRLGPFADASRPAVRSLGQASKVGARAFRRGTDETRTLRTLSRDAPGTFKPLRQFLQSLDDRKRGENLYPGVEPDPRAKVNGPPRTDKTYNGGSGGFTGMESLWNYFFWQSQSINGFDAISHVLRISADTKTLFSCPISGLNNIVTDRTAANAKAFDQCKQWLGPNQPGITTPDFTDGGSMGSAAASTRASSRSASPAEKSAENPGPERLDAKKPAAGQPNLSKPNVTLPPSVQKLLQQLPGLQPSKARKLNALRQGAEQGANPAQLLDYLMSP